MTGLRIVFTHTGQMEQPTDRRFVQHENHVFLNEWDFPVNLMPSYGRKMGFPITLLSTGPNLVRFLD